MLAELKLQVSLERLPTLSLMFTGFHSWVGPVAALELQSLSACSAEYC